MDVMIPSSGGKKIIRSLILLGLVLITGTMGYMIIEGWHSLEALYMTVITITTVGYGEIRKIDEQGRIFTIFLIFNPSSQTRIEPGDTLIALGHPNDLDRLSTILASE